MEATTTSGGRSLVMVVAGLIAIIALSWLAWQLARIGAHPAAFGAASAPPTGSALGGGGLPWG